MRLTPAAALAVAFTLILVPALALAEPHDASSQTGVAFTQFAAPDHLPQVDNAGEPTLGIPWNTDSVFFMAGEATYRIRFDETGNPTWEDVTPPNSILNVDPMLHADPDLGRVWAGGLDGPCSIMAFSDDDGETWIPTGNMCSGAQFDHQSIGSGPHSTLPAGSPTFAHATYYCAQLGTIACATSLDGGASWGPFVQVAGPCGGLHGHIRVSRTTGMAAVPDDSCGGPAGFAFTDTNGLTWGSKVVDGSDGVGSQGFDPSVQFTRGSGWLYYGLANEDGAHIALSKDDGETWESIGGGMGESATWLDVGAFHDPPIVAAAFSDVQAGDDDRVAFAFLGLADTNGDGTADEWPEVDNICGGLVPVGNCRTAEGIHQCDEFQDTMVWHYYVALSYDAGATWTVERASPDPVQVGGIWPFGGGVPCRNLLDFNDMDMDSKGRLTIGFADGCINDCALTPSLDSDGSRAEWATVLQQTGGKGLFAAFDDEHVGATGADDGVQDDENEDSPAAPIVGLVAGLAALALLGRRRA